MQPQIKTFISLLFGHVVQIFIGLVFSVCSSRIVTPAELGLWSSAIFFFNGYSMLTDLGLEIGVLERQVCLNADKSFFQSVLLFRSLLSLIPFFVCLLIHLFLVRINIYIFFYAIFFWIDKTSNLCKVSNDKYFLQLKAMHWEISSFVGSNLLALFLSFSRIKGFFIPVQKIFEKAFLLFGLKDNEISLFNYSKIYSGHVLKIMKKFSLPTFVNNLAGLLLYDFIPFFIAFSQGVVAAGIYAKAFAVAAMPMLLTTVFNRVTTPLYAAKSGCLAECKKIFLKSQGVKFLIMVPIIFFMQLSARFWFCRIFGNQWLSAQPVFQILCFYVFARSFYDDLGPLVNIAMNKPFLLTKNQLFHAGYTVLILPLIYFSPNLLFIAALHSLGMILASAFLWKSIFATFEQAGIVNTSLKSNS